MAEDKQSSVPINAGGVSSLTAPTPVNTPLNAAPISQGLSHPTVPDIQEEADEKEQAFISKLRSGLQLRPSGVVEVLPAPVARRVEGLKGVHAQYCKIEHELKREMLELEKKYLVKFTPIFERRKQILLGTSEPTPEEVAAGEAVSEKDDPETAAVAKEEREEAEKNLTEEDKAIKGIPHFWLTALRNHDGLSDLITEKDEAALEHLTDIRLVYLSDATPGFKLLFDFAPNPFFENETLEKSYHYQDELGDTGDYIYDRAVGTEIKWKEEKDLTKAVEIKKQRNKTTNRTRLIRRSHSVPSFFNFFNPPAQPAPEQIESGEVDEDFLEELDEKLELDYQIGEDLKERIIPRAIDYYTGKALEYDLDGIEDDDDYEDMDDDGYDDDDSMEVGASPSRRGKRGNQDCSVNEEISACGTVAQVAPAPPRKQARTKKSSRSKKKKENSIPGLLTLPVELITEVMHYLKPVDILKISRTCKSLRSILMRRSSEPIWNRAAENLSYCLPPPPPWLDMPQYISVTCGSKSVPKTSKWDPEFQPVLFVRLCVDCQPSTLIHVSEIPEHLKPLVAITHVNIFPGSSLSILYGDYALRGEVQKLGKQSDEKRQLQDEEQFNAWERAKSTAITKYLKASRAHWNLIEHVEEDRVREKRELEYQFRRNVEKRLTELGWGYDIDQAGGKEWRTLTRQPRNLTDRIWNNLYPKLQKILEEARSRRLNELPLWKQKCLSNLWEEKRHELGTRVIVQHKHMGPALETVNVRLAPPPSEAMEWPQVKQILDLCQSRHEIEESLLESWEDIHQLAETWQRDVESQLASRLQGDSSSIQSSDPGASVLTISGEPVSKHLDVLLRADSIFRLADDTVRYFPDDFLELWSPPPLRRVTSPFVVEGAQCFPLGRKVAKALLQYLEHPNATHLSMNAYGSRFVCGACVRADTKFTNVYHWTELLNHHINTLLVKLTSGDAQDLEDFELWDLIYLAHLPDVVKSDVYPPVYILSVDDARKYTVDNARLVMESPWSSYTEKYACLHCPSCDALDLPAIRAHVQYTHYVMEPQAHRDYESYEIYVRESLEASYEYES